MTIETQLIVSRADYWMFPRASGRGVRREATGGSLSPIDCSSSFQSRLISDSVIPCGERCISSDSRRASSSCRINCGGALSAVLAESDLHEIISNLHFERRTTVLIDANFRVRLQLFPIPVRMMRSLRVSPRQHMLQLQLVGAEIFVIELLFRLASDHINFGIERGLKSSCAGTFVNRKDASGKDRAHHDAGHEIFL